MTPPPLRSPRAGLALAVLLVPALALAGTAAWERLAGTPSTLPEAWRTMEPIAFERWLDATFPDAQPRPLADDARAVLRAELDTMQPSAVRAAAVFARSAAPESDRALLERLEARANGPERRSDAGDLVAAASLRTGPLARGSEHVSLRARLSALATGDAPHPDLEVRVQCAAVALALGADGVAPFLLRVLRIDTHAGRSDPRPWADVARSAWARDTAAAALAERCGLPVRFRADASIPAREAAADELELALLEVGALPE